MGMRIPYGAGTTHILIIHRRYMDCKPKGPDTADPSIFSNI